MGIHMLGEICLETEQPLTKDVPSSHLHTQSSNIKVFVKHKYFYSLLSSPPSRLPSRLQAQ